MPEIIIKNLFNRTIDIPSNQNIFVAIQENHVDWMHACGAKGRCTTCKFIVVDGMNNITAKSEVELRYEKMERLKKNERLACQCAILDDITILVPKSSKMPHMKYSN